VPIWLMRMRARRRVALEDRLDALRRQIQGIESENAYLRNLIRRCGEESRESPDEAHDLQMARLADDLRRNSEFLKLIIAEEYALARKLGPQERALATRGAPPASSRPRRRLTGAGRGT